MNSIRQSIIFSIISQRLTTWQKQLDYLTVGSVSIFIFREHILDQKKRLKKIMASISCRHAWVPREELVMVYNGTPLDCAQLLEDFYPQLVWWESIAWLVYCYLSYTYYQWIIDYRLTFPKWGRPWSNGNKKCDEYSIISQNSNLLHIEFHSLTVTLLFS